MAELGFILSKMEEGLLVQDVLDMGAWLVPDIHYQTPELARITMLGDYERFRKVTRLFFILHPSYLRVPLDVREASKEGKSVYFIMQRNGGPTIDFLSSVEFSEGGEHRIKPGFIAHYSTFWNTETQQNEKMPAALLKLYRELSGLVRRLSTPRRTGVRTYWIGKEVQQLLAAGSLHLGIDE
jgi:hypothetical protein